VHDYELIDVSHVVEAGMITYKGLPPPVISEHLSRERSRQLYAPGTEFHIGKIEMVANTGTYIDSPFHRYAEGSDLSGLDLYSLANLDAVIIRKLESKDRAISGIDLAGVTVKDKAVLFHTGWDTRWRTEAYSDGTHPFVTADAAEHLAAQGAMFNRYRLLQHRRHRQPASAGALNFARTWHPHCRASLRPGELAG
jgi:arylformamidase